MLKKYYKIIILVFAYALRFLCSRGLDGQLFFGVFLHSLLLIAVVAASVMYVHHFIDILITTFFYALGNFLGVLTLTELDGMAGLLFFIFPFFSFAYFCVFTFMFCLAKRKSKDG